MISIRILKFLYPYLYVLLHPSFWTSLYTYNSKLDKELNILLESGTMFTNIKHCSAQFGPFKLWTENYPYAAFRLYDGSSIPSRYTRKLLMDRLVESQMKRFKS